MGRIKDFPKEQVLANLSKEKMYDLIISLESDIIIHEMLNDNNNKIIEIQKEQIETYQLSVERFDKVKKNVEESTNE